MTDRRAEAFAALHKWEAEVALFDPDPMSVRMVVALRSVLERHEPVYDGEGNVMCGGCGWLARCPDETAVIDAVLGSPQESTAREGST